MLQHIQTLIWLRWLVFRHMLWTPGKRLSYVFPAVVMTLFTLAAAGVGVGLFFAGRGIGSGLLNPDAGLTWGMSLRTARPRPACGSASIRRQSNSLSWLPRRTTAGKATSRETVCLSYLLHGATCSASQRQATMDRHGASRVGEHPPLDDRQPMDRLHVGAEYQSQAT